MACQGEEGAAGLRGGSIAWAVDGTTGALTTTFFMLMTWDSVEVEQECERLLQAGPGSEEPKLKKTVLGRVLERRCGMWRGT